MALRIVVDRGLCQGHGVCESEAPALFAVSKQGDLTVLDEHPGDDRRKVLELAVKYCPTHALTIVEEPEAEEAQADTADQGDEQGD